MWSYAKLGHHSADVDHMVAVYESRVASGALDTFSARDLSNISFACAHLGCCNGGLLSRVVQEACPRLHEFSPQGLANLAWSTAKAGKATPEVLDALAGAARDHMHSYTPQGWANILWAFGCAAGKTTPKVTIDMASGLNYSLPIRGVVTLSAMALRCARVDR